jgi:DNA-directed RNA polymerase subunit M/transcription elongation factor TFIIS
MEGLALEVKLFLEKKKDMTEKEEDIRAIEKFLILNPGFIKCPSCKGQLKIHHWEKGERPSKRTPFFKCKVCGFLG